jgi:hypothetical protein
VSLLVWVTGRVATIVGLLLSVGLGVRLILGGPIGRIGAGFLSGVGLMLVAAFSAYGIHPRFVGGGFFGSAGLVAMLGAAIITAGGLLAIRATTRPDDGESKYSDG